MATPEEIYDDAMFDFSQGEYDRAIGKFRALLAADPANFDAQLSLAMCFYRQGDYATAIAEGHKAEQLRPDEQLVHTNLSLMYMKAGDKQTAEKHGLKARIASWKGNMAPPDPSAAPASEPELQITQPKPKPVSLPAAMPDMPWKKNKKVDQ
jgi:tetratricopeptide (TPR) repeat protein